MDFIKDVATPADLIDIDAGFKLFFLRAQYILMTR